MDAKGSVLIVLACALAIGAEVRAQEPGPVTIHGFVSQGYLQTSANRLFSTRSDDGTFAFTEEALNFTAQPVPRLRVAAQLFARDLGQQGNHRVIVDWALGDYRFRDWLGVKAGKVKLPIGLYNTLMDADVARPEVMQPPGVYPLSNRDIISAVSGASLYGLLPLGGAGDLEYEVWGGTIDLNDSYIIDRFSRDGAVASLPTLSRMLRLTNANYQVSDVHAEMKHHVGGALEWRPLLPGLRFRVSGFTADTSVDAVTTYTGFAGPSPISLAARSTTRLDQRYLLFLSAEYRRGGLRLAAEHFRAHTTNTTAVTGIPGPSSPPTVRDEHPFACYGQVAYRFDARWQVSGYYSIAYGDGEDKEGLRFSSRDQPTHRAWHKDGALTVRADVNPHWLVKVEVHSIDGTGSLSPAENPTGAKQRWTLVTAKTTIHF